MIQTIYYKCGHTSTINMSLMSRNARIKRAEDMGKGICTNCDNEEIKKYEEENFLPLLTGSTNQIKWASKIRNIKLTGKYRDFWDKNKEESSFWIENRNRFRQPR